MAVSVLLVAQWAPLAAGLAGLIALGVLSRRTPRPGVAAVPDTSAHIARTEFAAVLNYALQTLAPVDAPARQAVVAQLDALELAVRLRLDSGDSESFLATIRRARGAETRFADLCSHTASAAELDSVARGYASLRDELRAALVSAGLASFAAPTAPMRSASH